MDLDQALAFTDTLVFNQAGTHLSDLQQAMLRESWSWQRQSYDQIAEAYGYSPTYLKHDIGPKLWKLLSSVLGEKVNKTNFRAAIERHFQAQAAQLLENSQPTPQPSSPVTPLSRQDWGDATTLGAKQPFEGREDGQVFYGREAELTQLHDWIVGDDSGGETASQHCQLVTLLGMGGMGKTSLSIKLAQQLKSQFDVIIWRSLRNATPLQNLLIDWLQVLSPQALINPLESIETGFSQLLQHLRSQRCLFILDNVETILQSGHPSTYRPGYERYGDLFRQFGDTLHRGTLILTSREKPLDVRLLEELTPIVRSLVLGGLAPTDAQKLLESKGAFEGSEANWQQLIASYSGNPLALKLISTTIQNVFNGSIADFLQQETFVFGTIRGLIQQQFDRSSEAEKTVLYWLAIYREPAPFTELKQDIFPPIAPHKLIETLESLEQRSLIERQAAQFSLQPAVMEYVLDRLVEQVVADIQSGVLSKTALLKTHALLKAQAKDYVREAQVRLILRAVIEQVQATSETPIEGLLMQLVKTLQQAQSTTALTESLDVGYAGGNILNVLCQLQSRLSDYDFSRLPIWQANLQQTHLYNVNFSDASFNHSAFIETLGIVFSVAFSPDGTRLATGDVEGGLRIWQRSTGQLLLNLEGHFGWVWSVAFRADGRLLASCGSDKTIRLWDSQSGVCLKVLTGHTGSIWSIAFSPDGQTLASGSDESSIRLWQIESGECDKTLSGHTGRILSVAFSPTGDLLASGSDDRTIRLWNLATDDRQITLNGHTDHVWSVVFSSDGATLASGSADRTIRLWNARTGECFKVLDDHSDGVRSLQFSPDNQRLISSSDDKTVRVWDLKTYQCIQTLSGHTNSVFSVSFNADGALVATGSSDQTVRLWNVDTGRCIRTLKGYTNSVFSVAYNTDGSLLATGSTDQLVRLWDAKTGTCLHTLEGHRDWVTSVAFHPTEDWIATSSVDRSVRLWSTSTGQCLKLLDGHTNWVQSVAFNPDGTQLASASDDQTVRLWDGQTGTCLTVLYGHTSWVWAVAFSPDGVLLASSSEDATVRLWSAQTGECQHVLEGHTSRVQSIAFHPTQPILASASGDQTVRLWSTETGECLRILHGHDNAVWAVAFSPDGVILASRSLDQTVKIWDSETGHDLQTLSMLPHPARSSIVVQASGSESHTVTTGSRQGIVQIYDVQTGDCLTTLVPDRPYQNSNFKGVTGITPAQEAALSALGAIVE
jgi:WD40 repeat protein